MVSGTGGAPACDNSWSEWSECTISESDWYTEQNIGERIRVRSECVSGQESDREVRLCELPSPEPSEEQAVVPRGVVIQNPGRSPWESQPEPVVTRVHISRPSQGREELLLVMVSLLGVLLGGMVFMGTVLWRKHRELQRQHRFLVLARGETETLIGVDKVHVQENRELICGMGPLVTIYNPMYDESEDPSAGQLILMK
eukprot:sb/3470768/